MTTLYSTPLTVSHIQYFNNLNVVKNSNGGEIEVNINIAHLYRNHQPSFVITLNLKPSHTQARCARKRIFLVKSFNYQSCWEEVREEKH